MNAYIFNDIKQRCTGFGLGDELRDEQIRDFFLDVAALGKLDEGKQPTEWHRNKVIEARLSIGYALMHGWACFSHSEGRYDKGRGLIQHAANLGNAEAQEFLANHDAKKKKESRNESVKDFFVKVLIAIAVIGGIAFVIAVDNGGGYSGNNHHDRYIRRVR